MVTVNWNVGTNVIGINRFLNGIAYFRRETIYIVFRTTKGAFSRCPEKRCNKRTKLRCFSQNCAMPLGIGPFETGCYCSTENPRTDNRHANELEQYLKENNGICPTPNCGRHPGFCSICQKLFSLLPDGTQPNKVYIACCNTYYHRDCWSELKLSLEQNGR